MSGFSSNLNELDTAARQHLPQISTQYTTMVSQLTGTDAIDGNLAADPPVCASGGLFAIGWAEMRAEVAKVLSTSSQNAASIGKTLEKVVEAYAVAESTIATNMDQLNQPSTSKK
jgi:hypothetical protein